MNLDKRYIIAGTFFGFLGVIPHILFSIDVGKLHWMESAWDENSYLSLFLKDELVTYRLFGASFQKFFLFLTSGHMDAALILMDFFAPFICAFLAAYLVKNIGYKNSFCAVALLLVPMSFLALSDINFWGKGISKISPFAMTDLSQSLRVFLPNITISFFPIYRTPEPQASLILFFGLLLALIAYFERPSRRTCIIAMLLLLLLPYVYISIGVGFLIFFGGLSFLAAILKKRIDMLLLFLFALANYVAVQLTQVKDYGGGALLFNSHLPILTPSVLWGGIGCFYLIWKNRLAIASTSNWHLVAFCSFAVPIVTLNQQIITGLMIQSRNWEFYINYIFSAIGILIVLSNLHPRIFLKYEKYVVYIPVILGLLLLTAQVNNFLRFKARNLEILASVSIIHDLEMTGVLEEKKILLDSLASEGGITNRIDGIKPKLLPAYLSLIRSGSLKDDPGNTPESISKRNVGFSIYKMRGFSKDDFENELNTQIRKGSCESELLYFFALMDCWGVLSDYRALKTAELQKKAPLLVAEYGQFIIRNETEDKFVFLTTRELKGATLISSATAGKIKPVVVRAYAGY